MAYFSSLNNQPKPYSMRKLLLLSTVLLISASLLAQKGKGNQQKSRDVVLGTGGGQAEQATRGKKDKEEKSEQGTRRGGDPIWDGTYGVQHGGKASKNQPAKVRAAFARDYPNTSNVSWSKYRGDWTATFHHGATRSTAVYHANGERRDTRTVIPQAQAPRTILDEILRRRAGSRIGDIIRIEGPRLASNIFRVKTTHNGMTSYLFYNEQGKEVKYDY